MKFPWEVNDVLTEDRIEAICLAVYCAAADVLDLRDIESGDDNWALQCRAHSWIRARLALLAEECDWLEILKASLEFEARIGGKIRFHFYRDDPDSPSYKSSRPHDGETLDGQFELPLPRPAGSQEQIFWRVLRDVDRETGEILSVSFVGLTADGRTKSRWDLELEELSSAYGTDDPGPDDEGVELESPSVTRKEIDEESESGEEDDE